MKYVLIIRPEAEQDMQGAFGWYEDRVPGLGKAFVRCVEDSLVQIKRFPLKFPILYQNIHRILIGRFPFGIFYMVIGSKIVVLAVLHARRDPSLWQKRKK